MRKALHILVPFSLVILALAVARTHGAELVRWDARAAEPLGLSPLSALVVAALVLPVVPALLFNQVRVMLLAGLLLGAYAMAGWPAPALTPAAARLLAPLFALVTLFLTYLRERGLANRFGLARLAVAILPLLLLSILDRAAADVLRAAPGPDWLYHPAPGTATPYFAALVAALAVAALARLRGTEYPIIAPAFAAAIVAATIGLDRSLPAQLPLAFIAAGLALLWTVYLLSWGRAYEDPLTGLLGRRALEETLSKLTGQYALAMADVDRFKRFNDTYGHETGDDVLRLVAKLLRRNAPGTVFRYGGEEFAIVMPGMTAEAAARALEEVRREIAATPLVLRRRAKRRPKSRQTTVTVSFGVAEPVGAEKTPAQVLAAADRALYKAKQAGRNRVAAA
ncbi:MAG: GGDEF domain-containing protein [Myxococcales bacterium]|nr:MAG: GGDEF domain-containing protein [Myxococcales bacterium]